MKPISNYQIAKNTLKWVSLDAKSHYRGDNPVIRMIINDSCDDIIRDSNLTEYQQELLCNYACTLHP